MRNRIYLNNEQRVFLNDSRYAREINSVLKDATVKIENDKIFLERNNLRTSLENVARDENGYFFDYLEDFDL